MVTAALLLGLLPAFAQAQPATRTLVVKTGDTVVIRPGTDARIVFTRPAEIRISGSRTTLEVVVLVDEEKGDAPPDSYVDRVYRYTLEQSFPEQYAYRGSAIIEEVEQITEGAARRPRALTFITPTARLRFGSSYEGDRSDDVLIRTTAGQARELMPGSYAGGRSFDEVEQVWLNHQEDSLSSVRASLKMEVGPAAGGRSVALSESSGHAPSRAPRDSSSSGSVLSWNVDPARSAAGATLTPPRLLTTVAAPYTSDAMRRGVQGTVRLELTVIEDGSVSDAKVIDPLDPDLDREAVKSARRWRFRPAQDSGRAIPATVIVEMPFAITAR